MTKRTILFRRQYYQYQNQNNVQAQDAVQSSVCQHGISPRRLSCFDIIPACFVKRNKKMGRAVFSG